MASEWSFDDKIAPIFDEHVRKNVPMYDEIHRLITDIAGWHLDDESYVYDIGTSTGEVLLNLANAYPNKQCTYIGLDTSKDMIAKANDRFVSFTNRNFIFLHQDIRDDAFELCPSSLITSVLTMQFLPVKDRLDVLKKIHGSLLKGGGFILVEKVSGEHAKFNEMWIELYHELKLRNGMTEKEVFQKARAIRGVLKPLTLTENLSLLQEAGFKDMDVFFKWTNFAGIIAMK